MKATVIIAFALAFIAAISMWWFQDNLTQKAFTPTDRTVETRATMTLPTANNQDTKPIEIIAENLNIPWEIAFLPSGELLVTERPGQLLKIGADHTPIPINGVAHVGEGGLLGLALHPNFSDNQLLYLYLTTRTQDGLTNRVERYRLVENALTDRKVILEHIPGAQYHDGGRIKFGPDGKLYITTGDAGTESNAQNLESLAGKILRLEDDGSIPADNPLGTTIFSYGHRNPQGLAWDNAEQLWTTEHGRSGVLSGFDEINLIRPGTNYGWPEIQGNEVQTGMQPPVAHSGPDETWAPSGAAVLENTLLFTGLRGEALYATQINGQTLSNIVAYLPEEYGRLRTVAIGPDNMLYILTSNQDGRGTVHTGDDKIIRIDPATLLNR